jgi:GNAT superfamily N-acetyltransferase
LILERPRSIGPMVVRRRLESDLGTLVTVLAEVHRHDGYPTYWPDDPRRWLSPRGLLGAWAAETEGLVIGQVALAAVGSGSSAAVWESLTGLSPVRLAELSRLFVVPAARGTGAGADLLDAACAGAAERGLRPVLDVVETNRDAIRLYERHGWRRVFSEPWREARDEHLDLHYYVSPAEP